MKNKEDSRRLSSASQNTSDNSKRAPQDHTRLPEQDTCTSVINMHDKESVMNLFEDKLEMKVANVAMTLSMSSVTGLTDLAEDEIIPKPIPMQVYLFIRIYRYIDYFTRLCLESRHTMTISFSHNDMSFQFIVSTRYFISDLLRKYIVTFKRRSSAK